MKPFSFYLITDPHYFKNSLGARGEAYDEFMRYEQKCFAETQCINEAVFDYLEGANEADTLLIAGDLSFNGEKESHIEFIKHLNKLKESGKKIYVVTADHDFKERREDCFCIDEEGWHHPENTPRAELFDMYYEFGFKDAIAVDKQHLSYVAQVADGVRLLALNNDGPEGGGRFFDDKQLEWIKEQCQKAKDDGQMMFAMNHYPLIPGQPILSVVKTSYQKHSYDVLTLLADMGVHLVFTGHMHNQSINVMQTEKGNKIYDVCTGSIIADPSVIRHVTIESEDTVDIKTIPAPDFDWDTQGKTCTQYLKDLFDNMILNTLGDMATDPERVMRKLGMGDKKKMKPIIKLIGKRLNKVTIGHLCRVLWIKCDKSIRKKKLKTFAADLVRQVFEGNQSFKEGTPEGDVFLKFIKKIRFALKKINAKGYDGKPVDIYEALKNSAGNYDIDDYNAVLKLK